jgi:hypothetical protein
MEHIVRILIEVYVPIAFIYYGRKSFLYTEADRDEELRGKWILPFQRKWFFSKEYVYTTKVLGAFSILLGVSLAAYEIYCLCR